MEQRKKETPWKDEDGYFQIASELWKKILIAKAELDRIHENHKMTKNGIKEQRAVTTGMQYDCCSNPSRLHGKKKV